MQACPCSLHRRYDCGRSWVTPLSAGDDLSPHRLRLSSTPLSTAGLQNRLDVLRLGDVIPLDVEFRQDLLGVLPVLRGPCGRRWCLVELHWRGDDSVLLTVVVDIGHDVSV